jgi:ComF family protein
MVDEWLEHIQQVILPASCILCGARGQPPGLDLCAGCAADLSPNASACALCASAVAGGMADTAGMPQDQRIHWVAPVDATTSSCGPLRLVCGRCLRKPPAFDAAYVPYLYGYPTDRLIHAFKYQGALSFGRVLGTLLALQLRGARTGPKPQALIPVPLHPARHRERGFNQAHELARPIARLLDLPIEDRLCRRVRNTADQTELLAGERRKNVRRAFAVAARPLPAHVAIVDDVLTTGSTTTELARTLKRAGVKTVEVWAVARASGFSAARTRSTGRQSAA